MNTAEEFPPAIVHRPELAPGVRSRASWLFVFGIRDSETQDSGDFV